VEEIFGPGGLIARAHPDYEYRPGQVEMAEAVLRAFEGRRHLIVEAGTGTGKTLAYLVPAIAAAVARGGRVVVSTGTKNLQEQLMEKDIPFLQRVLPKKFSAAYMKGRGNYVCLSRMKRAEHSPVLDGLDDVGYFDAVRRWSRDSQTGDRAELTELPESLSFWRHIDARSEICTGQKCADYDACYVTRMRQRATDAELVIVNHHLFFADLALRGGEYGQVIPDYSAVIFDEAHQVEDVAAEYFGAQVSNFQVEDMLRDLQTLPITDSSLNRELSRAASRVSRFAEQFWMSFARESRADEGRFPIVPGTARARWRPRRSATRTSASTARSGAWRRRSTRCARSRPRSRTSCAASARRASTSNSSSRATTGATSTGSSGGGAGRSCAPRPSTFRRSFRTSSSTASRRSCSPRPRSRARAASTSSSSGSASRPRRVMKVTGTGAGRGRRTS
jgi:Rad3-related DNA helicase